MMKLTLIFCALTTFSAGAVTPALVDRGFEPSCGGLFTEYDAWSAARAAEISFIRMIFAKFRADGANDGEWALVSSTPETDVEAVAANFLDRAQVEREVIRYGGEAFDPTYLNTIRITVKSRASLDALTRFLTSREQSEIFEWMSQISAVRLIVRVEASGGRRTTQFAVVKAKSKGLRPWFRSAISAPSPLLIMSERRVPPATQPHRIENFLIDGDAHQDNEDFGQTAIRIHAIREQMGLDPERLETFFRDTAGPAARALLNLAGYQFDPYANDFTYFKPATSDANESREVDELFFRQSLGALRIMVGLSYVWIDPWRLREAGAPGSASPVGWVPRLHLAPWPEPKFHSRFINDHRVLLDGVDRPAILALSVEAVRRLGYEWQGGWVKRARLE